jgi:hypothetical protein
MARQQAAEETVTLEELVFSNSFEIASLVSVLGRKGLPTSQEVIEEIKRLRNS